MSDPSCQHQWAKVGYWVQGAIVIPCLNPRCGAYVRVEGHTEGFGPDVAGLDLDMEDAPDSGVTKLVAYEVEYEYCLTDLDLAPGAVAVDIGAHVGVVSVYLARRYGARVLAFEPQPDNYQRLLRNIAVNGVGHLVTPHNLAITGDGRPVGLGGGHNGNSGGWSIYEHAVALPGAQASATLAEVFAQHKLERVDLLKIDCEGAEYEILQAAGPLLGRVDRLVMELHLSASLEAHYGSADDLLALCQRYIPADRLRIVPMRVGA